MRYAKARFGFLKERDINALRLEYTNAALQRAKKMPKFETLIRESKPPTLAEIADRFGLHPEKPVRE